MSTPIIFPWISRQPTMDSSHSIEDDTIRDKMESGYVATRPRFTRARRSWKANIRNLTAADLLTLENFAVNTTVRGGLSWYFPNMVVNGGFEQPATVAGQIAAGWQIAPNGTLSGANTPDESVVVQQGTVETGGYALETGFVEGFSASAGESFESAACNVVGISVTPGATYAISAEMLFTPLTGFQGVPEITYNFCPASSSASTISSTHISSAYLNFPVATGNGSWQSGNWSLTAPAGAALLFLVVGLQLNNTLATANTIPANCSAYFDNISVALTTPVQPLGRMVGSQPLGCEVRFTKLPEFSDMGFGGGVKVYGCSFEIEEV